MTDLKQSFVGLDEDVDLLSDKVGTVGDEVEGKEYLE